MNVGNSENLRIVSDRDWKTKSTRCRGRVRPRLKAEEEIIKVLRHEFEHVRSRKVKISKDLESISTENLGVLSRF